MSGSSGTLRMVARVPTRRNAHQLIAPEGREGQLVQLVEMDPASSSSCSRESSPAERLAIRPSPSIATQ